MASKETTKIIDYFRSVFIKNRIIELNTIKRCVFATLIRSETYPLCFWIVNLSVILLVVFRSFRSD